MLQRDGASDLLHSGSQIDVLWQCAVPLVLCLSLTTKPPHASTERNL